MPLRDDDRRGKGGARKGGNAVVMMALKKEGLCGGTGREDQAVRGDWTVTGGRLDSC
jgi:hypothetical protein